MQAVAFAVALLPGEAEAVRVALVSCQAGARKEAYQDARRRAGIIREAVWIQPAPGGDVAVVYLEADNLATAFTIVGTSAEPFDRWSATMPARFMASPWTKDSPRRTWCSTSTPAGSDPSQERMRHVGTADHVAVEARQGHGGGG